MNFFHINFVILSCSTISFVNLSFSVIGSSADFQNFQARIYLSLLCPRYIGCENGQSSTAFDPCCIKCDCDPSCVQKHSCCLNSPYSSNDDIPYVSQQTGVVCRNAVFKGEPDNMYVLPEYEFVQACFESTDVITKLYCENVTTSNKSDVVVDNTPVYDKEGQRSYRNIHCAKCNQISVSSVAVWQPKLTCKGDTDLQMTDAGLDRILQENRCDLEFVPPSSVPDIPPCFHDVITECNVTGDWAGYNADDAYLCPRIDLIYVPIFSQTRKYKNIFCARCNGETHFNASLPTQCPYIPPFDSTTELITLLSFTVDDLEDMGSKASVSTTGCPRNYPYDPLMDDCMPLYCSPPYYLDVTSSTCELFHRYVTNVRVVHPFYLIFDTIVSLEEVQPIVKEIREKIFLDKAMFTCVIGVHYQTSELGEIGYLRKDLSLETSILGVYFMIYSAMLNVNPVEVYDAFTTAAFDYLSINNSNISVTVRGADNFDPKMLRPSRTNETVNLGYEEFTVVQDGGPSHYIFLNPYDNTIILGHIDNSILYCTPNIFQRDFLSCPAFMYELTTSFVRIPDGLSVNYKNKSLIFPFSEFKSVNSSTIRICSKAVIDRVNIAMSSCCPSKVPLKGIVTSLVLLYIFLKFELDTQFTLTERKHLRNEYDDV